MIGRLRNAHLDTLPVIVVVATLYFAREFFIPLALSILISFLLAPLIRRLEHWKLGRVGSVIFVTLVAFLVLGAMAYIIGGQLIDLADELPKYKTNLSNKVAALRTNPNGPIGRATQTLKEVTQEMAKDDTVPSGAGLGPPAPGTAGSEVRRGPIVPVEIVHTPSNAFEMLKEFAGPILGPLGNAAVVIIFVIFILLEREDLRDRIIHLVGRGHLPARA